MTKLLSLQALAATLVYFYLPAFFGAVIVVMAALTAFWAWQWRQNERRALSIISQTKCVEESCKSLESAVSTRHLYDSKEVYRHTTGILYGNLAKEVAALVQDMAAQVLATALTWKVPKDTALVVLKARNLLADAPIGIEIEHNLLVVREHLDAFLTSHCEDCVGPTDFIEPRSERVMTSVLDALASSMEADDEQTH